jgi:hypothetical protein
MSGRPAQPPERHKRRAPEQQASEHKAGALCAVRPLLGAEPRRLRAPELLDVDTEDQVLAMSSGRLPRTRPVDLIMNFCWCQLLSSQRICCRSVELPLPTIVVITIIRLCPFAVRLVLAPFGAPPVVTGVHREYDAGRVGARLDRLSRPSSRPNSLAQMSAHVSCDHVASARAIGTDPALVRLLACRTG